MSRDLNLRAVSRRGGAAGIWIPGGLPPGFTRRLGLCLPNRASGGCALSYQARLRPPCHLLSVYL